MNWRDVGVRVPLKFSIFRGFSARAAEQEMEMEMVVDVESSLRHCMHAIPPPPLHAIPPDTTRSQRFLINLYSSLEKLGLASENVEARVNGNNYITRQDLDN